jgi:hypothetical protein
MDLNFPDDNGAATLGKGILIIVGVLAIIGLIVTHLKKTDTPKAEAPVTSAFIGENTKIRMLVKGLEGVRASPKVCEEIVKALLNIAIDESHIYGVEYEKERKYPANPDQDLEMIDGFKKSCNKRGKK